MGKLKFLTPEQKEFYKENGFVKLSGVFTDKEFQEISDEYDELFTRKQNENMEGLESKWFGKDIEMAAGNVNITVSIM